MARILEKGSLYPIDLYGSPTYISWNNMKNRCSGFTEKSKKNYKDRGISFDPRWKLFSEFLKDMGIRPKNTTLERINNDLGYNKKNCRWATYSEQNRNRRTASNIGIKHITRYNNNYIVYMRPFKNKHFNTLEEAKTYRAYLLDIKNNNLKIRRDKMIVDQIVYTKRHNEGDYCYSEFTVTASLDETDDVLKSYLALKTLVSTALTAKAEEIKPVEPKAEEPKVEEAKVEEVKEKKTRAKKEKPVVEEVKEEAPVSAIPYDRNVEAHRQMLSAYLTQEHPTWKTKEGIKEFSASLVGKDFLDFEGIIVDSFKSLLKDFFA